VKQLSASTAVTMACKSSSIRWLLVFFSFTPMAVAFSSYHQPLSPLKHATTLQSTSPNGDLSDTINNDYPDNNYSQSDQDPFSADAPLVRPLGGGTAMIFEMARKCMLDFTNDVDAVEPKTATTTTTTTTTTRKVLPRWHPHKGISDANPRFRTHAPIMNNQGFARNIWRNLRKRNKPSLWRHALRNYDRMATLEHEEQNQLKIQRSNIHHEGAMLACAKLGLWQRAFEIYHYVHEQELEQQVYQKRMQQQQLGLSSPSTQNPKSVGQRRTVFVSDNMILSLVRACVRASKQTSPSSPELSLASSRRVPLDAALEILSGLKQTHSIPLVSRHVNPVAAAYQALGYREEGRTILQTLLGNRTIGDEPENGMEILNVHDICAKDKGSYSLLVQGAVASGAWAGAVEALGEMTDAGLFPNSRNLNAWTEISERQRQPRAVGSWKKKRDDYWLESVR
jgi:hypothetical protein